MGYFDTMQTFNTHSFIWRDHGLDKLRGGNGCRANGVCSSKEKLASRTSFICWRIVTVKSEKKDVRKFTTDNSSPYWIC